MCAAHPWREHTGAAQRHVCHSIYLLGPGRKAGGRFEKDVRPDPEPCDLLASYIQDEEVRHDFVKRIAQCPDVATLCQTVLTDLFNEVFCDCVEPAKLIKSKEFINAIIPCSPSKQGKSLRNIRRAIVKYVLGRVERLHILIFRGEMFAIKEKNGYICLIKKNEL